MVKCKHADHIDCTLVLLLAVLTVINRSSMLAHTHTQVHALTLNVIEFDALWKCAKT